MLFISERRLRGFVRATLTLSPRPEHSRRPTVNTQADQVHGLGQYLVLQRLFPGLFARISIG